MGPYYYCYHGPHDWIWRSFATPEQALDFAAGFSGDGILMRRWLPGEERHSDCDSYTILLRIV